MKRHLRELTNYLQIIPDKGLISTIYKGLLQLKNNNKNKQTYSKNAQRTGIGIFLKKIHEWSISS